MPDLFLLGWTGDYDTAGQLHRHVLLVGHRTDFQTDSQPWGKDAVRQLKAADAISTRTSAPTAYEQVNKDIMESTCPLPDLALPAGDRRRPDVQGLVASPLTDEKFDTVTVSGK